MQKAKDFMFNGIPVLHFDYEEFGIQGVGKNKIPIVNMDQYIDHTYDDELHIECCKGLALSDRFFKMGMFYGDVTPEEESRLMSKSWTNILKNLELYDPNGIHTEVINDLLSKDRSGKSVYQYIYFAMNGIIPWFFGLEIKHNDFFKKTSGGVFTEAAKNFPKLLKYLETLPFKNIGRVLIFNTFPNSGVVMHRDAILEPHKDHNINLFFSSGSRPSFIWNEKTKEKIYLENNARSYFFNNRDYHGVDPEPRFRYTVRVDGTFTDELCDKLGLVDGYTWNNNY